MKILLSLSIVLLSLSLKSQPTIKVSVSSDTISIGETVDVTYSIENGEGKLNLPNLNGLPVISGPNTSSSFSYQNGKQSSSQSYSFRLRGMDEGKLHLPGTTYENKGEILTLQPIEIVVLRTKNNPVSPKVITETPGTKTTREKKKF